MSSAPQRPALRPWHALAALVVAFALLRGLAPELGQLPRALTAAEADTLLGAQILGTQLVPEPGEARAPLSRRLQTGFSPTPSHPRLATLPAEAHARRAVLEPPLPRWLGALGMTVLPAGDDATNLARAGTASALAVALALGLLLWGLRREPRLVVVVAAGALSGTPGVLDAALSAGHGASAILVSCALLFALERVARGAAGPLGRLGLAALVGLALAIHPAALVLYPVVLIVWAIHRRPEPRPAGLPPPPRGTLALPRAPLSLLILPLIAIAVLIAIWPALWNDTGRRLGAWLLDFGSTPSPTHEVLGLTFDQATGRSAQAFTAILQWVAWTPLPILALWVIGVARAIRRGRDGGWAPIIILAGWLGAGALDGGLFGGRNSLLALSWVPTCVTAARGAHGLRVFVERRIARRGSGVTRWLAARGARARATAIATAVLVVPLLQSARGTTLGLARHTGAELRAPMPLALIEDVARNHPWAIVYAAPDRAQMEPALAAARNGMALDLFSGGLAEARVLILTTPSGAPPPPWPELQARLVDARALGRDPRHGLIVSAWDVGAPARLDKRPALPHN